MTQSLQPGLSGSRLGVEEILCSPVIDPPGALCKVWVRHQLIGLWLEWNWNGRFEKGVIYTKLKHHGRCSNMRRCCWRCAFCDIRPLMILKVWGSIDIRKQGYLYGATEMTQGIWNHDMFANNREQSHKVVAWQMYVTYIYLSSLDVNHSPVEPPSQASICPGNDHIIAQIKRCSQSKKLSEWRRERGECTALCVLHIWLMITKSAVFICINSNA